MKRGVRFMVFNATFNNISVISLRSVLLLEETRVPTENHRPAASHCQTLSHNVVSRTPRHERNSKSTSVVMGIGCIGNCKSSCKYHTIKITTTPVRTECWPLPDSITNKHIIYFLYFFFIWIYQIHNDKVINTFDYEAAGFGGTIPDEGIQVLSS